MADAKEKTIALLSSTTGVDMENGASATTLYTVPAGKTAYITHVVICNTTASLAGGTSYDFDTGWLQAVDLSGMTTSGSTYRVLHSTTNTSYTEHAAGAAFQMVVNTGATLAGTATINVYGFLL